ncbi:MAG TPA: thioredoxin domain-containing protein [Burkholderiaceae bacterium]|nr:thioredoxin domain-containing protein [Burkholderiaceae bacterium]
MTAATRSSNRLAHETSPYLLQHAHNPVDWYPWGEEAFAKARSEGKPIFLSIGYATCHWCHVMERESFEDDAIAGQLAEGFVAIKVDREELPDVDHVYMSALQAMSGHGGWPLNMFLTPDLKPFYGGTYFPPRAKHGMLSFADVLRGVRDAWTQRRTDVEQTARELLEHVRGGSVPRRATVDNIHTKATSQLMRRFDRTHGGFGTSPKFPQAPLLQYLLSLAVVGSSEARAMLTQTLHAMAAGGMYDHVGGGFARYSTDQRWHVPHFEKMLYDNAQLVRIYVGAYRLTSDERLRFVAEDTIAWMQREMHPSFAPTAYSSAQDADSEGVEGKFYVWTAEQLRAVLGSDADATLRLYGVSESGNWEHGLNVLERRDPESVRALLGLSENAFAQWERSVRDRLYEVRSQRVWPITDDKVLADWNGIALRALAEAGRLLVRPDLIECARQTALFLVDTMSRDGRLHHAWRDGTLRPESYLADHAQVGLGMLELHAATGELQWLQSAQQLAVQMIDRFYDSNEGFYDSEPGLLPMRARETFDGAVPSGTAAACELLLRLAGVYDRSEWVDIAQQGIERQMGLLAQAPEAAPALLHAHLLNESGAHLAMPANANVDQLGVLARNELAPLVTFVTGPPDSLPLLAARTTSELYLCQHGSCQLPARSIDQLRQQLSALHEGARSI